MKHSTYEFERVAFESAVMEHPGCSASSEAYRDWLMENGATVMGAKRIVTRTIRIATEAKQLQRLLKEMKEDPEFGRAVRHLIRRRCSIRLMTNPEIKIIQGPMPVCVTVAGGHYLNVETMLIADTSGPVNDSNEYQWVPRVEHVTVGATYVLNIIYPHSKQAANFR